MIQGHRHWVIDLGANRQRICNFLLVINSMDVNTLKILRGPPLSLFPSSPSPFDCVAVISGVQRFLEPLQVKYAGVRTPVTPAALTPMINSNFGVSRTVFEMLTHKYKEDCLFPHTTFVRRPRLRGNPSEFSAETYPTKSKGMGLLYTIA